jgi:hypothetical protein
MAVWLLVLVCAVAVLSLFFLSGQQSQEESQEQSQSQSYENFAGTISEYAAKTNILNEQSQFAGFNSIYVPKALNVNQQRLLNQALTQPDPLLQKTPKRDYSALFVENPAVAFSAKDNEGCRKATHPNQLLAQVGTSKVRCGWWYVDDPGTSSVGALGNYQGPLFPDTLPKGGMWMWNLVEAGKKEDIKRCKRLKACALVDTYNATPGVRCGFCADLGYGVPVDGAGTVLYPDDSGCDEAVAKAEQCPSPDNGGGGGVPGQVDGTTALVGICDVQSNGFLSPKCAISIAKMVGMSPQGGFITSESTRVVTPEIKQAYKVLRSYIPTMSWWTNVRDMTRWLTAAVQAQTTGPTQMIRNAAITLATGTPVDMCPTDPALKGPFDVSCLQQLFRQKGCQPAGKRYPTQQDAVSTSMKTWGQLNAEYTGLKTGMQSTDAVTQDKAVSECLGVTVSRDNSPCPAPTLPSGANNPTLSGFANPGDSDESEEPVEGFANPEEGFANPNNTVFSLKLDNYRNYDIVDPGQGRHVRAVPYPSVQAKSLQWSPGVKEGTIRFYPKGRPDLVFRHSGFVLYSNPYNPADELQGLDSSFYPRRGNTDPNKVSFESANFPGRFLRHAGFHLFLHPKDGSPLFNADSSFELRNFWGDINNSAFFKATPTTGWRLFKGGGWTDSIAIGSDGVVVGTGADSVGYRLRSIDANWEGIGGSSLKNVDCGNAQQVVGTTYDGSVYRYKAGSWNKLPFQNSEYASVAGDGTIAFLQRTAGSLYNSQYSRDDKTTVWGGLVKWLSLGPRNNDIAVLNPDGTTVVYRSAPDGSSNRTERRIPAPNVALAKVFMSKSNNQDVIAISVDNRLFGLDVDRKWSELPNPHKVNWVGVNAERIVGNVAVRPIVGPNCWTKQIKGGGEFKVGFDLGGNDFRQVNPPGGSTPAVCAEECKKDPRCGGFTSVAGGTCYLKTPGAKFNPHPLGGAITSGLISRGGPDNFTVVPNTVMNGTKTVPYANKGLEQVKKECRETQGCVGFNYAKNSKTGTFVMGKESGPIPQGAMDGEWIGSSIPIAFTGALSTGEKVYGVQSGQAKFVSASGVAKYFTGPVASFNASQWNTYTNAPGRYIALVPTDCTYYRKTG